jgi:hypothetical protein
MMTFRSQNRKTIINTTDEVVRISKEQVVNAITGTNHYYLIWLYPTTEDVFKEKYDKNSHHFEMARYNTEEKAMSALDGYMACKTAGRTFYNFPLNENVAPTSFEEAKTAVEKYFDTSYL